MKESCTGAELMSSEGRSARVPDDPRGVILSVSYLPQSQSASRRLNIFGRYCP